MKSRSVLALGLALTISAIPATVRAQELGAPATTHPARNGSTSSHEAGAAVGVSAPDVLALTSDVLTFKTPAQLEAARARGLLPGAHQGTEIRLSSGAKTAIIVTAIVVGVLIIVFAVGAPHHHF